MHKNATFLILFGTLLVAGGVVLYERQKSDSVAVPPVSTNDQQGQNNQLNRRMDISSIKEVIDPKISPTTGWKIFEHPQVPITFEYPGEMKVTKITSIHEEGRRQGPYVLLDGVDYSMSITFALPTSEGGYAWGFAEFIEEHEVVIDEKKFETSIRGDSYANSDVTTFYDATSLPKPFVAVIACKEYGCSRDKTLFLFRQFASSIKILPE